MPASAQPQPYPEELAIVLSTWLLTRRIQRAERRAAARIAAEKERADAGIAAAKERANVGIVAAKERADAAEAALAAAQAEVQRLRAQNRQ